MNSGTIFALVNQREEAFRKYLEAMENYEQAKEKLRDAVTSIFFPNDKKEDTK